MAIIESRRVERASSGESFASDKALVTMRYDIAGKSWRSIDSAYTNSTCEPTDSSDYGYGSCNDKSIKTIDTVESSDEENDNEEISNKERIPAAAPTRTRSIRAADRQSSDATRKASPTSAAYGDDDDDVIRRLPRSLPSAVYTPGLVLMSRKKNGDGGGGVRKNRNPQRAADVFNHPQRHRPQERHYRHAKRPTAAKEQQQQQSPEAPPGYVCPRQTVDDIRRERLEKKKRRETKTAAGAVGGMVAGGAVLGPLGVVVGAAVGGYCTRTVAKQSQKRAERKREQREFADHAASRAQRWHRNGDGDAAAVFV